MCTGSDASVKVRLQISTKGVVLMPLTQRILLALDAKAIWKWLQRRRGELVRAGCQQGENRLQGWVKLLGSQMMPNAARK